ncbi:MAG: hypothetical protein ABIG03_02150 [Candidatus Eisenbacteria bacterium]
MRRLIAACLLTACAQGFVSPALAQDVRIQHSPALDAAAWRPFGIDATLVGGELQPERIASVDVVVAAEDGGLVAIPLSLSRNVLFGEIPGPLVAPPLLRYYLRLVDVDGTVVTAPPRAPDGGLFHVPVSPAASERNPQDPHATPETVEILSPMPGDVVADGSPVIAAVFSPPLEEPWDALVTLDGRDVSAASAVTSDLFVLSPPDSLTTGAHLVTLSALTPVRAVETSWTFFVRERTLDGDRDVPSAVSASEDVSSAEWSVVGRVEAGWAVVHADTTSADSLDVFLPYEETSRPTLDFYASGLRGEQSFLMTAHYNPVYDDVLDWFLNMRTTALDVEVGRVFPSLSSTTLDWASGLGAVLEATVGRTTTKAVGMRMSEADTLAGFGVYSRFALGAMETFRLGDDLDASLVYLSVYDREESVPEEQRLADPLRNDVIAAVARAGRGSLSGELEYARSSVSGDAEGEGGALRARVGLERDLYNRVHLEYAHSEPDYYSAGSFEYQPGESALRLEFAFRPHERLRTSGWTQVGRTSGPQTTLAEDGLEVRLYGRAEATWAAAAGEARAYVVGRHDRTPYESYDYVYSYGALGGSWHRSGARVLGSVSWSRARAPEAADTWSGSLDVRKDVIETFWTVRVAGRWTVGSSGTESDYVRSHYTLESRWRFGELDLEAEYWLTKRDDRADRNQSYTEHVVAVSLGRSF